MKVEEEKNVYEFKPVAKSIADFKVDEIKSILQNGIKFRVH